MKVQSINVVFVYVEDIERSKKFYENTLGLKTIHLDTPTWVEWKISSGANFAISKASDAVLEACVPARSTTRFSIVVDDIKEAYNSLFENGVRVQSEPKEGNGFLYMEFLDLDGNVIRLMQWVKTGAK